MIPGHLDRTNHWLEKKDRGRTLPCKRTLREYFETNIFLTTAGNFSTSALLQAISIVSSDRILFSVDTPFENITEGATWFDTLQISDRDLAKIGRHNSLRLFPRLSTRLCTAEVEKLQDQLPKVPYLNQAGFPGKL
jgi:2,3-dihydroxybenzoate decarboxylase